MNSCTNIGVAAVGNVLDINCWSNIPYFFYKEGEKQGLFNQPWELNLNKFSWDRRIWNLLRLLSGKSIGGYQYSNSFLQKAESLIPKEYYSSTIISFNQTFPSANKIIKNGGKIYFYIDTCLYDLFNEESYGINIPDSMKNRALDVEKENYEKAEMVVTMGSWARRSLLKHYQIPEKKIHTILPGANISLNSECNSEFKSGAGKNRELVFGFIGKDWKRKGLPLILDVAKILQNRNIKVKIKALGNCPDELQNEPLLDYTGFVDKQHNTKKFIHEIQSCDIGCLFSESEALGISTLEFIKMGVPVAGFFHQGLRDTLLDGASFRFNLNSTTESIANVFEQFVENEGLQKKMQKKAWEYSQFVSWERCIEEWKILLKV